MPDPIDYFRRDKQPDKQDLLDRLGGRASRRQPYFEVLLDPAMVSYVLEKPSPHSLSPKLGLEDRLTLARRIGLPVIGMGMFWKPDILTRAALEQTRRQPWPDFGPQLDILAGLVRGAAGTGIGVFTYIHGPFDPLYMNTDMQDFWLQSVDDPGVLYEIGDMVLEFHIDLVRRIIATGVDIVLVADDLAFGSGTILPPAFMADYYPGRLRKLPAPIKEAGLPAMFHTDGRLDQVMAMLVDAGIDSLHPIEPYCNDIFALGKAWGDRLCLIGNVDLANSTPQGAADAVRQRLQRLGPRYIPCSSHSVTDDVKPDTYAAFLQVIHGWR